MGGHARDIGGHVWPLVISIVMGACGGWGDDLTTALHLPLPSPVEPGATLHAESAGSFLIGEAGKLLRVRPGAPPDTFATGDGAVPTVIAVVEDGIVVHSGDRLLRLSQGGAVESAKVDMQESLFEMDPRGRWIIQAAASGAVFGHSPATLTALWGWASLGERTTGLALSPTGAALFQAVAGELLLRDLQTGRMVSTMAVSAPIHQLDAAGSGRVYGIAGTAGRGTVFAIQMGGERSHIIWRRTLDDLDLGEGTRLRLSSTGETLAVFEPGKNGGLRMLNARTGEAAGSMREGPLDAAYGPNDEFFMLFPRSIRRLN